MDEEIMDKICQALEDMMDAADDAWEAEQRGSINKRDNIKESRYEPAKEQFKQALDAYIDNRIAKAMNKKVAYTDYDIMHDVYDL